VPEDWETIGRGYAADLRAASTEFSEYWDDMHVAPLSSTRKRLTHPVAGGLDVQCDFVLSTATGHRLVVFRRRPGTGFDFLRVLGVQAFHS
jgi:hypothetical protein